MRCKRPGCGMAITWAITVNDKRMPVDFLPSDDGNIVFENDRAIVLKKDDEHLTNDDVPRWKSHWVTCKNPPERKP